MGGGGGSCGVGMTSSSVNNDQAAITISDSKQNLKDTPSPMTGTTTLATTLLSTGNHLDIPQNNNPNLLSPDVLNQRRNSRRPSILPVPDMFTSSSFSLSGNDDGDEGDESDDEIDDDVPWRSPSEKIA